MSAATWHDQVEAGRSQPLQSRMDDQDTTDRTKNSSPSNLSNTSTPIESQCVPAAGSQNNLLALVSVGNHSNKEISRDALHLVRRTTATAALGRTYAQGARGGLIIGGFYSLPGLPIIYECAIAPRLDAVNNNAAIQNLVSRNEVTIRQLCQSIRDFASNLVNVTHKCPKANDVLNGSSLDCIECLCILISRMSLNAMSNTVKIFDGVHAKQIFHGFMLYAKSWLMDPIIINDAKSIVYAPTSVVPKMLASTVAGTYGITVDTTETILFKSNDTCDFNAFAISLACLHLSFTIKILEARIQGIHFRKEGQLFSLPFRTVSQIQENIGVVESQATLTPTMLKTLHHRNIKLSNIPCLRMQYDIQQLDKLEISNFEIAEIIRTCLEYIYTRVCRDASYAASFGHKFVDQIKASPVLLNFLRYGTFKVLGHGSGIIPAKIEIDTSTGKIVETFWHFNDSAGQKYDMKGLLTIFNPPVLARLTMMMYESLSSMITGNVNISITWVIEYFKSCYVLMTPYKELEGSLSQQMSKNIFGRCLTSLDSLSWDDDTSSINASTSCETEVSSLLTDKDEYTGVNSLNMLDFNVAYARAQADLTKVLKNRNRKPRNTQRNAEPSSSATKPRVTEVKDDSKPEIDTSINNFPLLLAPKVRFNKPR